MPASKVCTALPMPALVLAAAAGVAGLGVMMPRAAHAAPTFTGVLALPGGSGVEPQSMTADGSVIVGWSDSSNGRRATRWTVTAGLQDLGSLPNDSPSQAYGVSNDGALIVGYAGFEGEAQARATRWTLPTGTVPLQPSSSALRHAALAISGDGAVVTGYTEIQPQGRIEAFRWTNATGIVTLGTLSPVVPTSSSAQHISRDGSMIVGVSGTGAPGFGPEVSSPFRWMAGPVGPGQTAMRAMPRAQGAISTFPIAVSNTGVVAGYAFANSQSRGVRWAAPVGGVEQNPTYLPELPNTNGATVYGISDDGRTIVGNVFSETGSIATVWRDGLGPVNLQAELVSLGVNLPQWQLIEARAVDADGSVIAGTALFRGFPRMFVIRNMTWRCSRQDIASGNQGSLPDGALTADDIIVYLGWYFAQDPRADIAGNNQSTTPDGQFTADDIIVFLGGYFAGCP
jgi:probable HAF family extracellular repeat protein